MNLRGIIKRMLSSVTAVLFVLMTSVSVASAQITLGTSPYTESLDGVGSGLPSGYTVRTGATATNLGTVETFNTSQVTFGTQTGQFANYASSEGLTATSTTAAQNASTDRVIGLRQTGSFGDPGAAFVLQIADTTGKTGLSFSFKFQILSVQGRDTTFTVDYGIGATPTSFTPVTTVVSGGTFGSQTVTANFGTALDNQSGPIFIRIAALAASTGTGSRDTVAIDDVSITFTSAPATPPSFAINDVTQVETNSGTTNFVFTVTKTGTSASGSTVTYTTADGTATAGSDYTTTSGTLTFAAGDTSMTITVPVIGDTTNEPDETFFVNLTAGTNATLSDSQGQGTITNDDSGEPTVTLGAPSCGGLAQPPLRAGSVNRALMCFSLTSSSPTVTFTGLNVPFNSDPSTKYSSPRLYRSLDNDYSTVGDNTLLSAGTISNTRFTFTGFAAFSELALSGKLSAPNLTSTPTYFFVVADIRTGVDSNTPESTPSVSPNDITTTPPTTVTGATATSPNPITFAPAAPTAAMVTLGGRVVNSRGRSISRAAIKMTDSAGNIRIAYTNTFGYYRFAEVEAGQTLIFEIKRKGYNFTQPTQVVSVTEENTDINFTSY